MRRLTPLRFVKDLPQALKLGRALSLTDADHS